MDLWDYLMASWMPYAAKAQRLLAGTRSQASQRESPSLLIHRQAGEHICTTPVSIQVLAVGLALPC